jgi:hypothetical protein
MLLTDTKNLRTLIIEALATTSNVSADCLAQAISERGRPFSKRAIYKELKILERLGVVVRAKMRYGLQLTWIINATSLLHNAYLNQVNYLSQAESPLLSGKTKFVFHDLARLDFAWMQLIVLLQKIYPNEPVRVWKPEQWFHLVHEHITTNFFGALERVGLRQQHVIGHDCYTCRRGAHAIPRRFADIRFEPDPFGVDIDTYLTLIGGHLITVRLQRGFARDMRALFASVKTESEMKASHVREFMRRRVRCTLVIAHEPKGLSALRERFERLFG